MTLRIAEDGAGAIPWRTALPILAAAVVASVVLLAGSNLLADADTYWHLTVGQWILDHRAFPTADAFSFTFPGAHWIAKEWLSQVLYAAAYGLGGWQAMAILAAVSVGLAFALLARWLDAGFNLTVTLVFLAVAFVLVTPHLTARPHALALPVMIAWVGGLVRATDRAEAPSPWLLPLMVLWANLHGGFTLGILLVGACGLEAILSARPEHRIRTAMVWVRFGVLTLVAASITPYGPESMLVTFRILGLGSALTIIGEWQPKDFSHIGVFEVLLLLAIGFALYRGVVFRPVRILILLGLLHLALSAERNSEILGLLAPLFLAAPVARQFPSLRPAAAHPQPGAGRAVMGISAIALIAVVATAAVTSAEPSNRITPAAAVAALQKASVARILNAYDFGGYLIRSGIPTFIDGRSELYGAAFITRYYRAITLSDLDDFVRLLDEYRIGGTLLPPGTSAIAFLDRLPGWHRLYADDLAVVHVRDTAP